MRKKISVIIKDPDKNPRHVYISDSLENLQRTVGGHIQRMTIATDLVVLCDVDGPVNDKKYNCTLCGIQLFGTIVFCGINGTDYADMPGDYHTFKKYFPQLWKEVE